MLFSIIIPVFNRPDEIKELLNSLVLQDYDHAFEVVIIEDGSTILCDSVVNTFKNKLNISYYLKYNSGPGDSRNFGMQQAKGDYFIIFDSDCIIPQNYLTQVSKSLSHTFVDCYGGPDAAHQSFTNIQKAINFAMTSFLTTGGIRGGSEKLDTFQPRSFNMGISKKAFESSKGFGNIHPGEDPDLTIRLWKMGYKTKLISSAYVYHKRRIDWEKFYTQVNKFGKTRVILNQWHPEYAKITYWFPALFVIGFYFSIISLFIKPFWSYFLQLYFLYFTVIFIVATYKNRNLKIGYLSVIAVWKQLFGYGYGFIHSFIKIKILGQTPEKAFPNLFFKP